MRRLKLQPPYRGKRAWSKAASLNFLGGIRAGILSATNVLPPCEIYRPPPLSKPQEVLTFAHSVKFRDTTQFSRRARRLAVSADVGSRLRRVQSWCLLVNRINSVKELYSATVPNSYRLLSMPMVWRSTRLWTAVFTDEPSP
jgi:hypothetical protein